MRVDRRRVSYRDAPQVIGTGPQQVGLLPDQGGQGRDARDRVKQRFGAEVGVGRVDGKPERGGELFVEGGPPGSADETGIQIRCPAGWAGVTSRAAASRWPGPVRSWTGSSRTRTAWTPAGSSRAGRMTARKAASMVPDRTASMAAPASGRCVTTVSSVPGWVRRMRSASRPGRAAGRSRRPAAGLTAVWGLLATIASLRVAIAMAGLLLLATPLLLPRRGRTRLVGESSGAALAVSPSPDPGPGTADPADARIKQVQG